MSSQNDDDLARAADHSGKKRKSSQMNEVAEARMEFFKQAARVLKSSEGEKSPEDRDPRPFMKEIFAFGQVVQENLARFDPMQRVIARKRITDVLYEVEMGINMNNRSMSPFQAQGHVPPFSFQHDEAQMHSGTFPHYHGRSSSPASSVSSSEGNRLSNAQLSQPFFSGFEYEQS